jgi:hypothetical protein
LLHSFPTIVPFRSVATLAFADPEAKKHASPAVNGRRLPPSFFGLLQPPPLLRSQAARRNGFAWVYLRSRTLPTHTKNPYSIDQLLNGNNMHFYVFNSTVDQVN